LKGGDPVTGINDNLEIITKRRWKSFAQDLYTRNMKQHGMSLSACTILEKVSWMIVQRQKGGVLLVKPGWRSEMERIAGVRDGSKA
jgi:hypothetical protein